MQEIHKVAILGAGALGASYASIFFEREEFSTAFIARGQRYTRLKSDGIIVNGKKYFIPDIHPEETTTPADRIIVACCFCFFNCHLSITVYINTRNITVCV